jgi:hypothetical protein
MLGRGCSLARVAGPETNALRLRRRPIPRVAKSPSEIVDARSAGNGKAGQYAAEVEDVLKRPLVPLGRLGKGEQAVKGTYPTQIADIAHEPGVCHQL